MLEHRVGVPFFQTKKFMVLVLFFVTFRILCGILFSGRPVTQLVDTYVYSHYLISYDLGFITRGLVGTVFNYLFPLMNVTVYFLLTILLPAGVYLWLAVFFVKEVRRSVNPHFLLLLGLLFFSLPPVFLPFRDLGRFDILLYVITLLCLGAIYSRPESRLKWSILLLLPLGALIHEVIYFMFIPSVLVMLLLKAGKDGMENRVLFAVSAVLLTGLFVLLFFAQQNLPPWAELEKYLRENNVLNYNPPDEVTLDCYSGYTFSEHLKMVRNFYISRSSPFGFTFLWTIPVVLPLIFLLVRMWRAVLCQLYQRKFAGRFLLFLLCAAPQSALIMVVVGLDFSRWIWAWLFSNFTLLFLLGSDRQFSLSLEESGNAMRWCVPGCCLFYLLMGQCTLFAFADLPYNLGLLTMNIVQYFGWQ